MHTSPELVLAEPDFGSTVGQGRWTVGAVPWGSWRGVQAYATTGTCNRDFRVNHIPSSSTVCICFQLWRLTSPCLYPESYTCPAPTQSLSQPPARQCCERGVSSKSENRGGRGWGAHPVPHSCHCPPGHLAPVGLKGKETRPGGRAWGQWGPYCHCPTSGSLSWQGPGAMSGQQQDCLAGPFRTPAAQGQTGPRLRAGT